MTAVVQAKVADTMLAFVRVARLNISDRHVRARSRNPIESTFDTVRLRTKVTKGLVSRAA